MKRFEVFLREAAARRPRHTALVCGDERLDYAGFDAAVERCAAALVHEAQLANGERCVVFLENRIETCVSGIFGTLRAGGVFSVINPTTKADKLAFVLGNCEASVLITQAEPAAGGAGSRRRRSPSGAQDGGDRCRS
jgi:long-chain acyl-CoA synthetase